MAKTPAEIRSFARQHTQSALNVLAGIMNEPTAPETARISAANSLLDRGWGKATQPISGDDDGTPLIVRIERVLVDPKNTDS